MAHRLSYHSTLGSRVMKEKKKISHRFGDEAADPPGPTGDHKAAVD